MSQKLRYFVKLDREGIPVAGSNITRTKKPKAGTWKEIYGANCCAAEIVTDGFALDDEAPGWILLINCGGADFIGLSIDSTISDLTTIQAVVDYLNNNFGYLGYFAQSGSEISLRVNPAISSSCNELSLSLASSEVI